MKNSGGICISTMIKLSQPYSILTSSCDMVLLGADYVRFKDTYMSDAGTSTGYSSQKRFPPELLIIKKACV